jgi:hypothetical protein
VITIHDLTDPDQPAVIAALARPCGMCGALKGKLCRSLNGYPMATVVHFERATRHYEKRGKK